MTNHLLRAGALSCALLASTCLTAPAFAQAQQPMPSERQHVDENGVDLVDGSFNFSLAEGSIGSGDNAIVLGRTYGAGGMRDNLVATLRSDLVGNTHRITIISGNDREVFDAAYGSSSFASGEGSGAEVMKIWAGEYRLMAPDGTETVFAAPTGVTALEGGSICSSARPTDCELAAAQTTETNGRITTYAWEGGQNCAPSDENGEQCWQYQRLRSVSNNEQYRLRFTFVDDTTNPTSGPAGPSWYQRQSAAFYNDAVSTTTPQATVTYSHPSANVTDVTTAGGQVWRLTTDSSGRLTGIQRPGSSSENVVVTHILDTSTANPDDTIVGQVTADGVTTSYSRVLPGYEGVMVRTDALGNRTRVETDLNKTLPITITDAAGRVTAFVYDDRGRASAITTPDSRTIYFNYDARGNVTQVARQPFLPAGLPNIVTSATYPATCTVRATCNKPLTTTDERGNVTEYAYDQSHGGVTRVTLPADVNGVRPQTRYTYSTIGGIQRLVTTAACRTGAGATDTAAASCAQGANESRTVLTYGTNGNVTAMSRGAGDDSLVATTSFTYDSIGNLLTEDGPLAGNADTVRHRYDAARRRVGTVGPDPDGSSALKHRAVRTTFRPDGQVSAVETGNVDSQTDSAWAAMSVAERVEIGFQGVRPVSSRFIAGGATEALTETSYDELGRVRCTAQRMHRDRFGITTDACTQSSQIAADPDRISRNVYDAVGRVTQVISGVGTELEAAEVTMTYTVSNEIDRLTDGEGNRTWFARDAHGRLVRTYFPLPVRGSQQESYTDYEAYTYDAAGNMLTRRLRDGQVINMSYDQLNRLVQKDLPGSDPTVTYSYDLLGQLTSVSQPGHALGFTYDALGRQLTQTSPRGTITSTYDTAGRRTRITHPDGFFVDQDYLVTGEMTSVRENGATSGVGVLATFAYDNLGRRTWLTRGNGTVTGYTYDAASRMTQLTQDTNGSSNDLTLTFGYNPAAQIASNTRTNDAFSFTAESNTSRTDTHNGLNQVLTTGGTLVSHDARGNTTAIGSATFGYDSQNRMTSAGNVAFGYDPLGRLSYSTGDPQLTRFAYDGASLISEHDYDWGTLRRYVHGAGIDEPLVAYEGSGTSQRRFLHADERGSIIARSDDSGNVTAINRYDEYGVPATTNVGRLQYTGQMWMPEIGMYHFRARVYNPGPAAGPRFMQTDPIGYGDGPNPYQAFGSDPVNNTDPSGTIFQQGDSLRGWTTTTNLYHYVHFYIPHPDGEIDMGLKLIAIYSLGAFGPGGGGGGMGGPLEGNSGPGALAGGQAVAQDGVVCRAVPFRITGVGPNQANSDARTSLTQERGRDIDPAGGGVAIKPQNFGVPSNSRTRNVLSQITLVPLWDRAVAPPGAPAIPPGLPSGGPYRPIDLIGPQSVRNEPGNHIDLYRYSNQEQAFRSTRTVPVVAFIPRNNVGVSCPR